MTDLNHLKENLEIFLCPDCAGNFEVSAGAVQCQKCKKTFTQEEGVPLLFWPHEKVNSREDVTKIVRAFYEKTPFPNYEAFENVGDLVEKAQKGIFARLLNEQLPFNIRILEVGCGTGQVSNFLGTSQRSIFGTDMCLNSLKLANNFREKNNLQRVGFYQMNLFKPIFKPESFSLVICNGVLHHTSDPFGGFRSISRLVKKGGYIIIGLYNKYGRLSTDARRVIFNLFGRGLMFLDPRIGKNEVGDLRKNAWFMDQYKHPHESKHTFGEVLRWFSECGFEFANGIPKLKAFQQFSHNEQIFRKNPPGNALDHFIVQALLTFNPRNEGGFFMMIGRKKN